MIELGEAMKKMKKIRNLYLNFSGWLTYKKNKMKEI